MEVFFLSLFALIPFQAVYAQSESNFSLVTLPRGIELQIPKGWWLLGADYDQLIQTSVEAAIDLSGIGLPDGQVKNLIAANSMPRSTYAAVRVDSTTPVSMPPSMFPSITAADVREFREEMRKVLEALLPQQGLQLIEITGAHTDKISGYPALVIEYRRTGPKGPVSWGKIIVRLVRLVRLGATAPSSSALCLGKRPPVPNRFSVSLPRECFDETLRRLRVDVPETLISIHREAKNFRV